MLLLLLLRVMLVLPFALLPLSTVASRPSSTCTSSTPSTGCTTCTCSTTTQHCKPLEHNTAHQVNSKSVNKGSPPGQTMLLLLPLVLLFVFATFVQRCCLTLL
jgi:hypothetical protein